MGSPVGNAGGVKSPVGSPDAVAMGTEGVAGESTCLSFFRETVRLGSAGRLVRVGRGGMLVRVGRGGILVRVGRGGMLVKVGRGGMLVKLGIERVKLDRSVGSVAGESSCLSFLSEMVRLGSAGRLVRVGRGGMLVRVGRGGMLLRVGILVRVGMGGMLVRVGRGGMLVRLGIERVKLDRSVGSGRSRSFLTSTPPVGSGRTDVMPVRLRIGTLKLGSTTGAAEHSCATRAAKTKRMLRAMIVYEAGINEIEKVEGDL